VRPWLSTGSPPWRSKPSQPLAAERKITLDSRIEGHWQGRGDAEALELVLLNLIGNALAYTPAGGHVRVELAGRGERVELRVIDDGPGIAVEEQAAIFDRLHHAPANEHGGRGTGIGLSLVREAVRGLGGELSLQSQPGQGSCFTVSLPAQRVERPADDTGGVDDGHGGCACHRREPRRPGRSEPTNHPRSAPDTLPTAATCSATS
jgi:anti-sigma regulatory factor (Ser/Thr protein kinase)